MGNAEAVSHPAQSKYGACQAHQKNGRPCGLAIVRGGFCMYHQPEEQMRRALGKLVRAEKAKQAVVEEISRITALKKHWNNSDVDQVGKTRTL